MLPALSDTAHARPDENRQDHAPIRRECPCRKCDKWLEDAVERVGKRHRFLTYDRV